MLSFLTFFTPDALHALAYGVSAECLLKTPERWRSGCWDRPPRRACACWQGSRAERAVPGARQGPARGAGGARGLWLGHVVQEHQAGARPGRAGPPPTPGACPAAQRPRPAAFARLQRGREPRASVRRCLGARHRPLALCVPACCRPQRRAQQLGRVQQLERLPLRRAGPCQCGAEVGLG